jgi:hypothetical protein
LSEKNEVQERAFFRRRYLAATIFDKNSYHTFHFYGKLSVSCFQWSCHQIRKISGTMMPLLVQKLDIFALHAYLGTARYKVWEKQRRHFPRLSVAIKR